MFILGISLIILSVILFYSLFYVVYNNTAEKWYLPPTCVLIIVLIFITFGSGVLLLG